MERIEGDAEFARLYEAHYAAVFRYALLALGPGDVDDIVAETFRKACLAWRDGRGAWSSPRGWLLTIARRTVIDAARQRARRPTQPLGDLEPAAPDLLAARETWLWFEAVTRTLPDQAREALTLRYAGDLSAEEVGLALGITASGARSAIHRALEALRRNLKEDEL